MPGALRTAGLITIPGNRDRALAGVARASARSGDVADALRIARSISFLESRRRSVTAVVEARAEVGDVAGALAVIPTLAADEQRGLEAAIGRASARAGDPSRALQIAQRLDAPADAVLWLIALAVDLLRVPAQEPDESSFSDLDIHPFR